MSRRPEDVALAVVTAVGFVLRASGAWDDGIFWPDEIYQSFEPAHLLVFGNGLIPWEFVDGARNWSVPGVVAILLKLCALLGLDQPAVYVRLVKIVFAAAGAVAIVGVARLARACGASAWPAVAAAALFGGATPVIYFAPRAMSENASAAPLVWGLALVLGAGVPQRGSAARREVLWGASLLGVAVLFRLQTAAAVLAAVIALAVARRFGVLKLALVVLAGWAAFYGLLDALTWHDAPNAKLYGLFHSAVVYVRFNVIEGRAAQWGVSPWYFYFQYMWRSMPTVTAALALGVVGTVARRQWSLLAVSVALLAIHVASPHKEYRFLVPFFPLAAAMVGVGLMALPASLGRLGAGAVVAAGLASAAHLRDLTFGELGTYLDRPTVSAWGDTRPVNRMLLVASQQADLCGLRLDVPNVHWTGGATYLHRYAPIYRYTEPPQAGHFNYVIGPPGYPLQIVAQGDGFVLYRLPQATCQADPGYTWRS